ncbi:MAG: hypothetical protein QM286_12230 [Acidobacteriota bacterium]|nr:hypothetical protein [Acidobacteriota bacterium]
MRFRARYTGRHSAPITFLARIDVEGWLVDQERMISRGEWESPARQVWAAPLLLGEFAAAVAAVGGFGWPRSRSTRSCSG